MKKILIAIDYNPFAEKVAETGYAVGKAMNAQVTIIHVITEAAYYAMEYSPIMGYKGAYTSGTIDVVEDIKKEAENFLSASVKHLGDNNIQTKVLTGDTSDAILDYCNEWNAEMVVMGSHSHKGLDRLFVTDVAAYILKNSKIPVLIIPTEEK